MGHLEGNLRPSYIWDARFLKVNNPANENMGSPTHTYGGFVNFYSFTRYQP